MHIYVPIKNLFAEMFITGNIILFFLISLSISNSSFSFLLGLNLIGAVENVFDWMVVIWVRRGEVMSVKESGLRSEAQSLLFEFIIENY